MSTAFVAGGAGLLGAAVARHLLRQGDTVVVADIFDDSGDGRAVKESRATAFAGHPRAVRVETDLSVETSVEDLFALHRPATVINAARFDPEGPGAAPLMRAARSAGVGLFVHLSDAALYGPPPDPGRRAREDEPIAPGEDPYLVARAAEEAGLREIGIPGIVLRVFELVGPSFPATRFIGRALEAIVAGEEIALPGEEPRDYLHLEDAARGVGLALEKRPLGLTLNLGSGIPVAPRVLLESLAVRTGKPLKIAAVSPGTAPHRAPRIADMENAWNALGFAPERTIEDIADEIFYGRLAPGTVPRDVPRRPREPLAPAEGPREVSRRDLFGIFRRPFDRR